MTPVRAWVLVLGVAAPLIGGCGSSVHPIGGAGATRPCVETSAARARVAALRDQFRVAVLQPDLEVPGRLAAAPATTRPVIGPSIATGFRHVRAGAVRPELPDGAKRVLLRSASVELPVRADGAVRLEDDTSHVGVTFALRGASDASIATTGGTALYRHALSGADVVHRPSAEGTEDFVAFESKPDREELDYDVDVSRVAGLRLVENVLEFIDHDGSPVLRMSPPYVVGDDGKVSSARIAVDGCAYDVDPAGPWGRAVTAPGASSCRVRVRWQGVQYPAMVDPTWTATGSMTTPRSSHTATLLQSGKVLIAGGAQDRTSAEIFDGTSTFAATGSMTTPRTGFTATLLASGKVLIAGGDTGPGTGGSAELFDGTSTFTATGSMTMRRSGHTATLLPSGKVLIAGGAQDPTRAELFDGISSFAATGSMMAARDGCTATLLPSGEVLFAGGSPGALASTELFDGTSSFTAAGSMTTARTGHAAALLPSGKVLIAGGYLDPTMGFSSAELFDGTSTFTATSSMTTARSYFTATLLPSGKVLVAGGLDSYLTSSLSSAELFTTGAGGAGVGGSGGADGAGGVGGGGAADSGVGGAGGFGPGGTAGVGGTADSGAGGAPDSGVGGTADSGAGGAADSGAGGAADSGLDGSSDSGPAGRSALTREPTDCGCHAAGSRRRGDAPWVVFAGLALLALRRRRR